jgi:NAD(P)-dependent dehydrogenase (short-subunit alcohol dehydrogenase family)
VAAGRRWIDAGERNKVVMSILTVSALMGAPFTVPSAMAKAGVLAMTKSLAVEWGPRGIRTCAIVPGLFPTEGAWSRLMPKERGGDEEELVKTIRCAAWASTSSSRTLQLTQGGAEYSDNPTFREEFQRIVEGARKAGLPER